MRESEERERNIDRKRKPEPWALRQARAKMFSITPKNVGSKFRFSSRKHLRTQPATRDPSTRNDVFNNP